jgi:Trk-type K+ transport system membrane component
MLTHITSTSVLNTAAVNSRMVRLNAVLVISTNSCCTHDVDIWWLVWGIWLVAIIERPKIDDPEKPWFDLFRICFELVSAFGGIGLSMGTPNACSKFSSCCVL